jgi:hypothetical protein
LIRKDKPLIESEGFFWSSKFEGALEGEADERFRGYGFGREGLPKFQNLIVFGAVECARGLTFEGSPGRRRRRARFRWG